MKNLYLLLIMVLIPLSLQAMTPISDEELAEISGQTGVSIWVDITMDIHIDCIAWGDSDGIGSGATYRSGGYTSSDIYAKSADLSIISSPLSLELWDILQKYRSSSGVCFFPEMVSMDFVDGVPQFR